MMAPEQIKSPPISLTLLGATGSIGQTTQKILAHNPQHFQLQAVTAHRNAQALATIARRFDARCAAIADPSCYHELKEALADTNIEVTAGANAIVQAAERPSHMVVSAIVGLAGLAPTFAAVARGATVALANKESLVAAGPLILDTAAKAKATIIPIDSEHHALFRLFELPHSRENLSNITLTASGGPFLSSPLKALHSVTPDDATRHPQWKMGQKISIDSATMMNKVLEVIEASYLFQLPAEKIAVLIHPQAIVHALTSYHDGSTFALMAAPDMRLPIAQALYWPQRCSLPLNPPQLAQLPPLTFLEPCAERFPALDLASHVLDNGPAAAVVLNAANEIAVAAFQARKIPYLAIVPLVRETLARCPQKPAPTLGDIIALDQQARLCAYEHLNAFKDR